MTSSSQVAAGRGGMRSVCDREKSPHRAISAPKTSRVAGVFRPQHPLSASGAPRTRTWSPLFYFHGTPGSRSKRYAGKGRTVTTAPA
jgi:hypothetical protein